LGEKKLEGKEAGKLECPLNQTICSAKDKFVAISGCSDFCSNEYRALKSIVAITHNMQSY
jgi:hypothetical protein